MTSFLWAQGNRRSPAKTASGEVNGANITINYSSPSVNDREGKPREIFGGLVPYGEVWRTGANEATTFETSKAIRVEGKTLPAGKYSLYTIPGEKEWTVIFNKKTGQWGINRDGSSTRMEADDALTVKVKPRKTDFTERMTFDVTNKGVSLRWAAVEVPLSIK